MNTELFRKYIDIIKESSNNLSIQQLATISDEALDNAYHYGRSSPGNTFGWQANLKSAEFAKKVIDSGVTDIEKISDAIHNGWNVTAKAFVQNPQQFDDTAKLEAAGKLEAKLQQREKLMNINYAQLPEDEKEKDRVVARALLQAITGLIEANYGGNFGGNTKEDETPNSFMVYINGEGQYADTIAEVRAQLRDFANYAEAGDKIEITENFSYDKSRGY